MDGDLSTSSWSLSCLAFALSNNCSAFFLGHRGTSRAFSTRSPPSIIHQPTNQPTTPTNPTTSAIRNHHCIPPPHGAPNIPVTCRINRHTCRLALDVRVYHLPFSEKGEQSGHWREGLAEGKRRRLTFRVTSPPASSRSNASRDDCESRRTRWTAGALVVSRLVELRTFNAMWDLLITTIILITLGSAWVHSSVLDVPSNALNACAHHSSLITHPQISSLKNTESHTSSLKRHGADVLGSCPLPTPP